MKLEIERTIGNEQVNEAEIECVFDWPMSFYQWANLKSQFVTSSYGDCARPMARHEVLSRLNGEIKLRFEHKLA